MPDDSTRQRFAAALDSLVDQVKQDRSILAALLCGSLSHDTVWTRSDIDLVLVTIDDRKVQRDGLSLYAEGVNVHANLVPRAEFRRMVEGSVRHSFAHAFLARGRLLYTHDPTIAALCATLADLGERDAGIQLLRAATHALPPIDKAHKWFVTPSRSRTARAPARRRASTSTCAAPRTISSTADIERLLDSLNRIVDAGHTVLLIEHHLDVIKMADHVIDLGPEGGHDGGEVVATGTPEAIAASRASHTGRFLKGRLRA